MQLLTFFVVGPALAIAIAYGAWRGKQQNLNPVRYGMLCITSGVAAFLLFGFAKWINADVRTAQYFLELACVLLSGLFFGVFVGCGFSVLLRLWRWHKTTRQPVRTNRKLTRDEAAEANASSNPKPHARKVLSNFEVE
jgi:hypothetical protein